jgi:ABC-type glycerol-3-phosphate transport system permease component
VGTGPLVDVRAPAATRARPLVLHRVLGRAVLYLVVIGVTLLFAGPFLWTISTSLKRVDEVYLFPPTLLPQTPRFENYPRVFQLVPYGLWFRNSALVAGLATLGTVVSTTLVAYGFARREFFGRNALFMVVVATMILPGEVTFIPQFVMFQRLGWVDTYLPLILPHFFAVGAFYIFLLRQFFLTIPLDFDEAARIDGAGTLRILWSILLPLVKPAMVTVAILSFLAQWDDFFTPLIYLNSTEKLTVSVGLNYFQSTAAYAGSDSGQPREHLLMAASLMAAAPVVALFFAAQRFFIQGIVMSGIKG